MDQDRAVLLNWIENPEKTNSAWKAVGRTLYYGDEPAGLRIDHSRGTAILASDARASQIYRLVSGAAVTVHTATQDTIKRLLDTFSFEEKIRSEPLYLGQIESQLSKVQSFIDTLTATFCPLPWRYEEAQSVLEDNAMIRWSSFLAPYIAFRDSIGYESMDYIACFESDAIPDFSFTGSVIKLASTKSSSYNSYGNSTSKYHTMYLFDNDKDAVRLKLEEAQVYKFNKFIDGKVIEEDNSIETKLLE